jgi:hypothetical protein
LTDRTAWLSKLVAAAALVTSLLFARSATADVSLVEKDGWEVFMNGRIQTFANYNEGQGRPAVADGNNMPVELRGGGMETGPDVIPEFKNGQGPTATDQGLVRELRIRSGFTGNVLGFGIRKRLSERTEILGYTAVTVGIDSVARRKFTQVNPDWRESFVRVTSFWGSLTAGRTLTLFSRGATEITYLYGYRYGLGFPGTVSDFSQSTAGSVGFGVLGNGFGAGLVYATPNLGGFQLSVGGYDAVGFPNTPILNRERWPRAEGEMTFLRNFGATGLFKLFVNGAWQRLYDRGGTAISADVYGTGFGGRFEIGPFKIGIAGHWGKGVGVTYSLEPHYSVYFVERTADALNGLDPANPNCNPMNVSACPPIKMRTVDGGYVQTQLAVHPRLDLRAGAGVTRVHQLPEDKLDWKTGNPTASVTFITIRQQLGVGAGMTFHAADNLHVTLEYFYAMYQWYKPTPAPAGQANPQQVANFVNAGVTYDF